MNAIEFPTKSTPTALGKPGWNSNIFPDEFVCRIHKNHVPDPYPECMPCPSLGEMLITDEIGRRKKNPPWSLVEHVIRDLDPGHHNSYACLALPSNTYVQCLRGFNGYHIEWRITNPMGNYVHYRACYHGGPKKAFELKKHDFVNDGEYRDLLRQEEVLDAFFSFHQGYGLPGLLHWRRIPI